MGLLKDWSAKAGKYIAPRAPGGMNEAVNAAKNDTTRAYAPPSDAPKAAGSGQPVAPDYISPTNTDGSLKDMFKTTPGEKVAAGQMTSGGDLGYNNVSFKNIVGGPAVGFKSIQNDAAARYGGINPDQRGMDALRERTLSTDLDPTTKNAMARQRLDETNQLEGAKTSSAGQVASAAGNLGMRGGLSGGANERLAAAGQQNAMDAEQNVRRAGQMNRLGLEGSDAMMKSNMLQALPGAELAWLQPQMHKADVMTGIAGDERNLGVSTDLANRDYSTGVDKYNTTTKLQNDTDNATKTMEAGRFNILNNQDVQGKNITNNLDASKWNSDMGFRSSAADAQNGLLAGGAHNAWNAANYGTQMGGWGAGQTADATARGGKK